jgi:hypothetical protein
VRKFAHLAIFAAFLGIAVPHALDRRWWLLLSCGLVTTLWLIQSRRAVAWVSNPSFGFLAFAAAAPVFFDHNPLWALTNLVILLLALDLDAFSRDLDSVTGSESSQKDHAPLIAAHLRRLALVAGLGWGLGWVALNLQLSFGFAVILGLAFLMFLAFGQVVRLWRQQDGA